MPSQSHAVTLSRLEHSEANTTRLQAVLAGAPRYARLTSGADPEPTSAASVFAALPPGKTVVDKFVYAIWADGACVGCVDLIRGYPSPATATLGLLLVAESHQGAGIGALAYRRVEREVSAWPEVDCVRIGVVETNAAVLPFWQRLGFVATGEVKPYANGTVTSQVRVLERAMPRPDSAGG